MSRERPVTKAIRIGATGLLIIGLVGLTGCSGRGAAEEPGAGPSSSAPASPNPGENTASPDPQSTEQPDPATTPVPPPSPGTINETVESRPTETKEPVPIDGTASFDAEVRAEITQVEAIDDPETGMPDEIAGPALAVTVELTNDTPDALSLEAVVVEVLGASGAPGTRLTGEPYDPLAGSLGSGEAAAGTYVYAVAKDDRDPITVVVTLAAGESVVLFQGAVK